MTFVDYRDPNAPRPAPVPVPYVPQPQPQPAPPAADTAYRWNAGVVAFIVLFLLVQGAIFVYLETKPAPGPGPAPIPTPTPIPAPEDPAGVKLGKAYAPVIVSTNATAWDAAAAQLAAGKEMDDAITALQSTWLEGRSAWFTANIKPAIIAILPAGEKLEPESRAAMISLFKGIAKGERGAK